MTNRCSHVPGVFGLFWERLATHTISDDDILDVLAAAIAAAFAEGAAITVVMEIDWYRRTKTPTLQWSVVGTIQTTDLFLYPRVYALRMGERTTPQECVAFDPDRTAIVLIEFQRQWTDSGLYNLQIRRSLNRWNVVERTREAVRAARAAFVVGRSSQGHECLCAATP